MTYTLHSNQAKANPHVDLRRIRIGIDLKGWHEYAERSLQQEEQHQKEQEKKQKAEEKKAKEAGTKKIVDFKRCQPQSRNG